MNLKEKVVVVTGASNGIGEQIALSLAKENTRLVLIARNKKKLEEVAKNAIELWAVQVKIYSCDISNKDTLESTLVDIKRDFPEVHVLINNAGIWQKMMSVDEIDDTLIDDIIATNLSAVIRITKKLLPALRKTEEAAIINVSSKSWVTAQLWQSVYTATKHGVRGFTDVLKEDLKETHIRVAWVYQAWTNTSMFANTGETMPIEKFSNPADLANIVCFMLSQPPQIWMHDVRVQF